LSCWLEVKPLPSGKFEAGNFTRVFEYLYNCGKPFRLFVADCPSSVVEGLRHVRLFIQLPDAELADRLANVLKANMEVEVVVEAQPPSKVYAQRVELELKDKYALPICNLKKGVNANPVDEVVASLSGRDAALEILAAGYPRGKRGILDYIARKTRRSASFSGALLDAFLGILDAFSGGPPPKKEGKEELNPIVKAKVEAAEEKAKRNLLLCEVNVYGEADACEAVQASIPFSPFNGFKARKSTKAVEAPPQQLRKPRSLTLENALSRLWVAPVLLIPLSAWFLGFFDPLRLSNLDLTVMAATAALAVALHVKFPHRNPTVLSAEELSLIAGMPTAVGQLPVETGTSRVTRRQFAFGKPITSGKPTEEGKAEKPEKAEAEGKAEGKAEEAKAELKEPREAVLEAFLNRPLKVEGVLSDPKTGAPIANVEYEVYEDGKRVFADATDEAGRFSFVFNADREGDVKLEVKARGYAEPVRRFEVRVKK